MSLFPFSFTRALEGFYYLISCNQWLGERGGDYMGFLVCTSLSLSSGHGLCKTTIGRGLQYPITLRVQCGRHIQLIQFNASRLLSIGGLGGQVTFGG